jgi:hypothetical protein
VTGIRTGAADIDDDGYISVDDAYAYAFDEMRAAGAQQTPQRWLYGAEGDIVLARNPAATRVGAIPTRRPDARSAGVAPRSAPASAAGSGSPSRLRGGRSRVLAAAVAVVAVVAVSAGVALWRAGSDEGGAQFTFRDGRYVDTTVPWRVTVSDRIDTVDPSAPDKGCAVKVREESRSGQIVRSTPPVRADGVIWQLADTGSFYLDVEDGCLVNADKGGGDASYPVTITAGVGDSLAWNPHGPMEITAARSSDFPCDVSMVNAETGGTDPVTIGSADDTQTYDRPGTSALYMSVASGHCVVTARDAKAGQ